VEDIECNVEALLEVASLEFKVRNGTIHSVSKIDKWHFGHRFEYTNKYGYNQVVILPHITSISQG